MAENKRYEAVKLAIGVVGTAADDCAIVKESMRFHRLLSDVPLLMLAMEYADLIEGILVDVDVDEGIMTVAVADPEDETEEVKIDLLGEDCPFYRASIDNIMDRKTDTVVKVYVGIDPNGGECPSDYTIRIPEPIAQDIANKMIWVTGC